MARPIHAPLVAGFNDFDALVADYRPRVVRLALRYAKDTDGAEDIALESRGIAA